MPRGTAKNGGRNGVRAKGEGREGKDNVKGKHCLEMASHTLKITDAPN
jgi:hypothetical protein